MFHRINVVPVVVRTSLLHLTGGGVGLSTLRDAQPSCVILFGMTRNYIMHQLILSLWWGGVMQTQGRIEWICLL